MLIAQQLYEGIDIGNGGETGLITYMRTDSVHVAPQAVQEARTFILKKYGESFYLRKHRFIKPEQPPRRKRMKQFDRLPRCGSPRQSRTT
jgi:DNA topoisomerase IA